MKRERVEYLASIKVQAYLLEELALKYKNHEIMELSRKYLSFYEKEMSIFQEMVGNTYKHDTTSTFGKVVGNFLISQGEILLDFLPENRVLTVQVKLNELSRIN